MPKMSSALSRAASVASLLWALVYFMINWEAFTFSWRVAFSTPSTMCSDVYAPGNQGLVACEAAGPTSWAESYLAKERGEPIEVPFDYYQRKHHHPVIWLWLFGVPIALFAAAFGLAWIRDGSARDRAEMR